MEHCRRYVELLSARLDGMLTGGEEQQLQEHLARCPQCRALEEQLTQIHAAFPLLEEVQAPEGFAQGVMQRIRGEKKVVPLLRRPQVRALASLAACALLCVGLYRVWDMGLPGEETSALSGAAPRSSQMEAGAPQPEENAMSRSFQDTAQAQDDSCAPAGQAGGAPERYSAPTQPKPQDPGQAQSAQGSSSAQAGEADQSGGDYGVSYYSAVPAPAAMTAAPQQEETVLVLQRLPDGGDEILGEVQWQQDSQGAAFCAATAQAVERLYQLAQEQGLDAQLSQAQDGDAPCRVVLSP